MKKCFTCNLAYDDNGKEICDCCGGKLEALRPRAEKIENTFAHSKTSDQIIMHNDQPAVEKSSTDRSYVFEERQGRDVIIRGVISGHNTQQFYQSPLTKFMRSMFGGEPYQLSHTTFVNTFRIREIALDHFAENERDVVVYGSLRNVLQDGDDITVTTRYHGSFLYARRIYSNSTNSEVKIENNISAAAIRMLTILAFVAVVIFINTLINLDYGAMFDSLLGFFFGIIGALIQPVLLLVFGFCLLRAMFKV